MKPKNLPILSIFFSLCLPVLAYKPGDPVPADFKMPEPLSLAEAVASIKVPPGFKVDLVAAEPMVMDPINLDWGPDGKLWVVEMADYPLGLGPEGEPGGRVRYLEDLDGDGRYDRSTVFMDGLRYPTEVKAWMGGVLIVSAPDVFFARDIDGDGRADEKEILYTGFEVGNSQHLVNTLRLGLDNWIYMANGDSNGVVRSIKSGKTVDISGRDLKIKPDTGDIETLTGRTQYGRCRDDWGNWFGCNNSKPNFHFALSDAYLRRNPYVAFPSGVVLVPEIPYAPPIFRISKVEARYNSAGADHLITGTCGLNIYRDNLFGEEFYGNTFVSESVHNLVHRQIMKPVGTTFTSFRAPSEQDSEFLASSDTWFRPAISRMGPDGALWVVDMHRYVIEHPEWIPDEWVKVLDLHGGNDLGRIYRVIPEDLPARSIPRLHSAAVQELVSTLKSPNGIQRDMAQQLLVERKDPEAIPELINLLRRGVDTLGRLHALYTLNGIGELSAKLLSEALTDKHPEVRRHAIRISESFSASDPWLLEKLLPLSEDNYLPLLQQLAYSLGEWPQSEAGWVLAKLVELHGSDPFIRASALSSAIPHLETLVTAIQKNEADFPTAFETDLMAIALGLQQESALVKLLHGTLQPDTPAPRRYERVAQILKALEIKKQSLEDLAENSSPDLKSLLEACETLLTSAPKVAVNTQRQIEERMGAASVLGKDCQGNLSDLETLAFLLSPENPSELQSAAIQRLGELNHPKAAKVIIDSWHSFTPSLRPSVLNVMLSRTQLIRILLDAIEAGQIPPSAVDVARRDRLFNFPLPAVRNRAAEVFGGAIDSNRQQVLATYDTAYDLEGNPEQGKSWFASFCSSCHQVQGIGRHVGPDLAAISDNSLKALMTAIIIPNKAVEDKYQLYDIRMKNGTATVGMLRNETGNSITVVGMDGNEQIILRNKIQSIVSTGRSQMPEGLEAALNPQQMADIHAFLSQ